MLRRESDQDQQLLMRMQRGDRAAMREAYDRYVGYLTAVCSRYLLQDEDVRDVLQEAFILIFTHIGSFKLRAEGSLKGWMKRIVVNESLKYLKQRDEMRFMESTDELPDRAVDEEDLPSTETLPYEVLQGMIRRLPIGYRTVFNLFVIEGKSHREIATLLQISEATSASQYHRAKRLLAERIKQYMTDMR